MGHDPCSEHMVKTTADAMVSEGLLAAGYNYVTLDDCWSAKTRNATGHLQAESKAFPNGMKHLADYVHSKGLYLGLYTCVGTKTCKGDRPGSFGYYERDAQTLADWGVDFVKMDHCGMPTGNHTDLELYGRMSRALNATGRPIAFSLCQWGEDKVWEWGASVAQLYRVQMDHLPFFNLPATAAGAGIGQGTVQIVEWMARLQPSRWVRSFGWMDPDFLMTLYQPTMDFTASRTEYSFWAIWSAPLLVATDVRFLSKEKAAILLNPEVIAINQDASATGADRLRNDTTGGQLWARPLANGDHAVLLFHGAGHGHWANLTVSWVELGWAANTQRRVRDLWARRDLGIFLGSYTADGIAPRDVALLRISPA